MNSILVTGASGFVGSALCRALHMCGCEVCGTVRSLRSISPVAGVEYLTIGNLDATRDWTSALAGVNCVVHCAARAHVMREHAVDALAAYRMVNVTGTLHLAQQAAAAGVQRFVFISSIKVNGEQTLLEQQFTEQCVPAPQDDYGQSKAEAEKGLLALAAQTSMEVVIIRPPLVYGPGVKGNFLGVVKAVQYGLPLPFGAVHNQRSLVALDNLVSLVVLCADRARSPLAANQVFVVADGEDVSTTTLLRKVAQAAGRPSRLITVPTWLLRSAASLLGKRAAADRLLGNLQVDATKARTLLGWRPVTTMDQQLAAMFAVSNTDSALSSNPKPANPVSPNSLLLRMLDVFLAGMGLLTLWPVLMMVWIVGWFDTRAPLFTQERVGRHQRPFVLVKFRTMRPGTASVASHLANSASITRIGVFLRRTKLDELPQLWNVLLGHMSLVGPRPGLFNQEELTKARAAHGVYSARPGITGLAQVSGIDMSTPELLAETDARMLRELNLRNYFKYIFLTIFGKGSGDSVDKK